MSALLLRLSPLKSFQLCKANIFSAMSMTKSLIPSSSAPSQSASTSLSSKPTHRTPSAFQMLRSSASPSSSLPAPTTAESSYELDTMSTMSTIPKSSMLIRQPNPSSRRSDETSSLRSRESLDLPSNGMFLPEEDG